MKKLFLVCCLSILVALCSCGINKVNISENAEGSVVFKYDNTQIDEALDETESDQIKKILNNRELYYDNPSCGFTENVSIRFNSKVFSIACDKCSIIKHNGKYLSVSDNDIAIIRNIMEKHGAHFPCV